MKAYRPLRGSGTFKRILLHGYRFDGVLVQFHYVLSHSTNPTPPLSVGFSISPRFFNAVERNRVRRLLREAIAQQGIPLHTSLKSTTGSMEIVIRLKGKQVQVKRIRFEEITKDFSTFCSSAVIVMDGLQRR